LSIYHLVLAEIGIIKPLISFACQIGRNIKKRYKMKKRQFIAVLMMLIISASLVMAQNKVAKKATPAQPAAEKGAVSVKGMPLMPAMNFTDEQKQKIQQLRLDMQKEVIKINTEIQLNKVELKKILAEKQLNTDKLASLTEANGKLELQVKKLRTDNWIKIYNLLNDDQKVMFKNRFEGMGMERPGFGRGMRGRGPAMGMMNRAPQGRMGQGMMQGRGMGNRMGQGMMQGRGMGNRMGQGMMQGRGMGNGMGQGMMQGRGMGNGMGQGMMQGKEMGVQQRMGHPVPQKVTEKETTTEKK
jgi:hypothetical protein